MRLGCCRRKEHQTFPFTLRRGFGMNTKFTDYQIFRPSCLMVVLSFFVKSSNYSIICRSCFPPMYFGQKWPKIQSFVTQPFICLPLDIWFLTGHSKKSVSWSRPRRKVRFLAWCSACLKKHIWSVFRHCKFLTIFAAFHGNFRKKNF